MSKFVGFLISLWYGMVPVEERAQFISVAIIVRDALTDFIKKETA